MIFKNRLNKFYKSKFFLIVFLLIILYIPILSCIDKGNSHFKDGLGKYNKGEYEEAINIFDYSILNLYKEYKELQENNHNNDIISEKKTDLSIAYFYKGLSYKKLEKWDKSVKDLTVCVNLNTNYSKAYAERAVSFYELGFPKRAIEDLTQAIQHEPYNATYLYNRANIYLEIGDYSNCIVDSSHSISIDNSLPYSFYTRAEAYKKMGDYTKAISDYKTSIKLFSKNEYIYEAYLSLGKCFYSLSKLKEAEKAYQTAFLYEENPITAYLNLAILYGDNADNNMDNINKAIQYSIKAVRLSDLKNVNAIVYLSSLYYKIEDYDKAYNIQKLAKKLKPADSEINEWLDIYKYKSMNKN